MGSLVASGATKITPFERKRLRRGLSLAKAYYLQGLTQEQAIQQILPRYSPDAARKHAAEIFIRYKVSDAFLSLFPETISPMDCERLLAVVKDQAIRKGDARLALEVIDRIAKLHNRYTQDIQVTVNKGEERIKRVELARKLLTSQGIDITKLDKAKDG